MYNITLFRKWRITCDNNQDLLSVVRKGKFVKQDPRYSGGDVVCTNFQKAPVIRFLGPVPTL